MLSGPGAVTLWDVSDRDHARRLGQPLATPDAVFSVAFDPTAATLAAGTGWSSMNAVTLWDISGTHHPRPLGAPLAAPGPVGPVAFAPDGRTLAASLSRGVALWGLQPLNDLRERPSSIACTITDGGLSPEEWQFHVPGLPYQKTCRQ